MWLKDTCHEPYTSQRPHFTRPVSTTSAHVGNHAWNLKSMTGTMKCNLLAFACSLAALIWDLSKSASFDLEHLRPSSYPLINPQLPGCFSLTEVVQWFLSWPHLSWFCARCHSRCFWTESGWVNASPSQAAASHAAHGPDKQTHDVSNVNGSIYDRQVGANVLE